MSIRFATAKDSEALCALLENSPMGEQIRLTFERRPDYFLGAAVQAEEPIVVVGEDDKTGDLFGVFAAGSRRVFVNGEERKVRYLSDLRIDSSHRGGTWLARGYRFLRREVLDGDELAQTLILSDNAAVRQILTSRRGGLPGYFPAGEYLTYFLSGTVTAANAGAWEVRQARPEDVGGMQRFFDREARRKQYYPCYRFEDLDTSSYYRGQSIADYWLAFEGEELCGILGTWDQSEFRQTRIQAYHGAIRYARPFLNLVSSVTFPDPGEVLPMRYLHTAVTKDNRPEILEALLSSILSQEPRFPGYWVLGLDAADPLNAALSRCRKRVFRGGHYGVSFGDAPDLPEGPFYFEAARI